MNEERIRELEEIGFVWALRGGEGRRDEAPMADMMYAAGAISTAAAMEVSEWSRENWALDSHSLVPFLAMSSPTANMENLGKTIFTSKT